MQAIDKIRNFRLKGFLKKRARKVIRYLSGKFDIPILEIKNTPVTTKKVALPQKSLHQMWDEIFAFEKKYPVNNLKISDTYVYPFIRHWLWVRLTYLYNTKRYRNSFKIAYGDYRDVPLNMRKDIKGRYNIKEIEDINDNVDYAFFCTYRSAENVSVENNLCYQRVTDSVLEIFKKYGKAQKFCFLQQLDHAYRHLNVDFMYPITYLFFSKATRIGYSEECLFSYDFETTINKYIESLDVCIDDIKMILDNAFSAYEDYVELLKRIKPKVIITHSSPFFMPLIAAADYLDIPSIDLQHGEVGEQNPLYSGYQFFIPKEGYETLPNYFFVKDNKSFNHIEKVFIGSKHKAILIGDPYLDKFNRKIFNKQSRVALKYQSKIDQYKKIVLILLDMPQKMHPLLIDIVQKSPSDMLFILRHHPNPPKLFSLSDFGDIPHNNLLIDREFDECLIGELFNLCHYTISNGSTAAKEAVEWGVGITSFIFNQPTCVHYKQEIEDGNLIFVNNAEEFYSCIERGVTSKPYGEDIDCEEAIKKFLNEEIGI
ncbi:hypothetical protein [Helicobacter pullorum]